MRAVVLVGGEGTRLRPLTETIPKPLIPLVDRPFLDHVLDRLGAHGVDEAILSSPYLGTAFEAYVAARTTKPEVRWVTEDVALGTGGAIANAATGLREAFLVCNGDILTDLDLTALIAFHRRRQAVATIALHRVADARPFGLVVHGADGRVSEFREKPADPIPGDINAGTYVMEPSAVEGVAAGLAVSVERETFPRLIAAGSPVFAFGSDAYWMDLGTPEKYLRATFDALDERVEGLSYVAPHVDPSAEVSLRSYLGRWVVLGASSSVGDDARVEDSVVLAGASVGQSARVTDSILGPGSSVGAGAVVAGSVLAEGAAVPPGVSADGARVGPNETLAG